MVLLSFSTMKEKLLNGEKRWTIRSVRKYPIEVGDILQVYWKVRKARDKKDVHFIGEAEVTDVVYPLVFRRSYPPGQDFELMMYIKDSSIEQSKENLDKIAQRDGFKDIYQLHEWFYDRYDYLELLDGDFKQIGFEWRNKVV